MPSLRDTHCLAPQELKLGFDNIRDLYALDEHFSPIYESCGKKAQDGFYLAECYQNWETTCMLGDLKHIILPMVK